MRNFQKILAASLLSINATMLMGQSGTKWSVNGNSAQSGDFIGTTNYQIFELRSNNSKLISLNPDGSLLFHSFSSMGNGLLQFDANGKLQPVLFTGNALDVLLGNGQFGSLGATVGWISDGVVTRTNLKVGIGIPSPNESLEVNGNAIFNGSVSAAEFQVGDVSSTGKNLRISTQICLDGYDPLNNMRNEICVFSQPLYINSKHGYNQATIINHDNAAPVGIGTDQPQAKLHVNGDVIMEGKSHFYRIAPLPGDSIIRYGDSSMVPNYQSHRIYATPNWYSTVLPGGITAFTYAGGIGIGGTATGAGYTRGTGDYSLALGYGAYTALQARRSLAIGNDVRTSMAGAPVNSKQIVLGSGVSSTQPLVNNMANSLMIGFNSDIPTVFVSASSGSGTTGAVGIGTTCIPSGYTLAVGGKMIFEEGTVMLRDAQGCWWPDFVFAPDYKLMSYSEKEKYLQTHHHLPNMQPAQVVEENGIQLSSTLVGVVQNVEENTLDIIQLYKMIEELKKENERLKVLLRQMKN